MMASDVCSDYVKSLPPDVRKRYNDKTSVIGCDPYNIAATCLENDVTKWPHVGFLDVVNYLIFSRSSYTSEQLKKYKSLESYKYFQDGWIRQILHKEINSVHLIRAKVNITLSLTLAIYGVTSGYAYSWVGWILLFVKPSLALPLV